MNSQPQGLSVYDDEPPPKNAEKYSTAITERVKVQKMLTQEFFKENVERARARNERYAVRLLAMQLGNTNSDLLQGQRTREQLDAEGSVGLAEGTEEEQHAQVGGKLLALPPH